MRPYELSTLLVALCAVSLLKWLDDSRARRIWAFSILALLATAMQLFSLLAPASMLLGVLVVRPELIRQRLRVLLAPIAFLAVASVTWVVVCVRELGQVDWIANESTESRLLAEIRGPVDGQFYSLVLVVIMAVAVSKLAIVWNSGVREIVVERVSRDKDVLGLTFGWAVIPTVILAIVSIAHPIFSARYVSASAPGVALLVAFILVRVFPKTLDSTRVSDQIVNRKLRSGMMVTAGVAATVLLGIGYLGAASAVQEDLQGPAQYVAQHVQNGDVIALPDHAITSAIDYYLARDDRLIPLWPQLGVRQRYVEGFDLSLHPPDRLPNRVWLVEDGSVPGVTRFVRVLQHAGYLIQDFKVFNGSTLLLYNSTLPTTAVVVPASGTTLSGTSAVLDATGFSYWVGTTKVQFLLSGGPYSKSVIGSAAFTKAGWYFTWNTTSVPNGIYSLQTLATNRAGRTSYSPAISIKVDN